MLPAAGRFFKVVGSRILERFDFYDFDFGGNKMFGPDLSDGVVTIRRTRPGDRDARFNAGIHSEIVKMYGGDYTNLEKMTDEKADGWYSGMETHFYGWVIEFENRCVGHCFLDNYIERHKKCHYATGLFNPTDFNKGIGTRDETGSRLCIQYSETPQG
jgi:hypothetical protein